MKTLKSVFSIVVVVMIMLTIHACDQSRETKKERAAAIIRANDELFHKGNTALVDELFAKDYSGGGPEHIKNLVTERKAAFPDLQVQIEPVIADGDLVAWKRTNTGTHKGDYAGHQASNKKVTWEEIILTRYNSDGKIAEESTLSNLHDRLTAAAGVDGIFQYLPPGKGQSINQNGRFVYLFGSADGKRTMTSQAGTQIISGDTIKNTITFSTDTKQIGTTYWWRVKSVDGDTLTYELMSDKGQITGEGRAVRLK
jgi:predicted ester cyclase